MMIIIMYCDWNCAADDDEDSGDKHGLSLTKHFSFLQFLPSLSLPLVLFVCLSVCSASL